MDIQEAVHLLGDGITLQSNITKRLFDAGVYPWEEAQTVAQDIIAMLFETSIPRPELIEAYHTLDS